MANSKFTNGAAAQLSFLPADPPADAALVALARARALATLLHQADPERLPTGAYAELTGLLAGLVEGAMSAVEDLER